jgi:ATP/maltotriose-dependent transcriptional regulator MalT
MVLDKLGKVNRIRLFRLHDLFRDFLMAMNEASLPELHNKAAEYYLEYPLQI